MVWVGVLIKENTGSGRTAIYQPPGLKLSDRCLCPRLLGENARLRMTGARELSPAMFISDRQDRFVTTFLKIEKLDLFNMHCLTDNHVKKLVTRCNKITQLNLGGNNSITKQSLSFIIENLKLTLVKLSFESTLLRFNLNDLLQLKGMENLKLLYYDIDEYRNVHRYYIDWRRLKRQLPNIRINTNPGNIKIACPSQQKYNPNSRFWEINHTQGLWEIKTEKEELFTA